MHPNRYSLLLAAALSATIQAPAMAQEAPEAAAPAGEAAPAAETPEAAPAAEPSEAAPADAADQPEAAEAPAAEPAAPPAPAAPATPEVNVTQHGDWEVGCIADTTDCRMQQVALDETDNPVVLVQVIKLPENAERDALMVFSTPLGTLLPPGLGIQIDTAPAQAIPFEFCAQEGCIVRLGMTEEDVNAMKRGNQVQIGVTSIADPGAPLRLTLSLTGFTAAYDSLTVPEAQPAPAAPAAPAQE